MKRLIIEGVPGFHRISTLLSGHGLLWSAAILLRELLHLAWIEERQRMSNNYQSHLVHPRSWCCSCVTAPPNPHIWSGQVATWVESPSPTSSTRVQLCCNSGCSNGNISNSENNPNMSQRHQESSFTATWRSLVFKAVMLTAEMGETEEDGVYHRRSLWAEWEASWLFNFHFDLVY